MIDYSTLQHAQVEPGHAAVTYRGCAYKSFSRGTMLWVKTGAPCDTTIPFGSIRRRGSHERRHTSFYRLNCALNPQVRRQSIYVLSDLRESDSSPSPPPPAAAPPPGTHSGILSSRSFHSPSHSSGSGSSSPPHLLIRALQGDDERDGFGTAEDDEKTYYLEIVQAPERTAEFGNAFLSRLPLAPPLVVQLTVRNRSGNVVPIHGELPFLVAHLSLLSENGVQNVDVSPSDGQVSLSPSQRLLYGTLVSSPHLLQNQQGQPGTYFIFPDVSVRNCGRYRLRVSLLKISRPDDNHVMEAGTGTTIVSARTKIFEVVPQAEYVAPATTSLTQCFHRQGARMFQPFSRS